MTDTLRLVTCLYGANGRLPFEGGAAVALLELLTASRRARGAAPVIPGFPWLDGLALDGVPDVRFDVVAGSSAGAVVGSLLLKQLVAASDPEAGMAGALTSIVEAMDVDPMTAPQGCPNALLDKRYLSKDRLHELLSVDPLPLEAAAIEPDAELFVALVPVSGQIEYIQLGGEWFEDVRYVDTRRFDRVDLVRRTGEVADTADASSANPWFFAPTYVIDLDTPAGHAHWLRAREGADPLAPRPPADLDCGPLPRVPCYDGGILDNRPLEAAIDGAMRRGLGTGPGEQLVVLVIDPIPERVERRQTTLLACPPDGLRDPHLVDQMAALGRAAEIVLHENISEDLLRLQAWSATPDPTPLIALTEEERDQALADAADRLLFQGEAAEAMPGREDVRTATLVLLGRVLAALPHGDRLRDGLLRAGDRVRRLLRQERLWQEPGARDLDGAARQRSMIARLKACELEHMQALAVERLASHPEDAATDMAHVRRLLGEAWAGRPLPAPRSVRARRITPPAGGLSSTYLEPLAGFLDRDFRCHDLLVGVVEGRMAVAELLPPAAAAAWRAHFRLESRESALAWFATAPERALPWRAWHAGLRRVVEARGRDRFASEQARLRPRTSEVLARLAVRFWAMAGTAERRGTRSWLYSLARGALAPVARFLVPWLLRFEARFPRLAGPVPTTLTRRALVALPPFLLLVGGVCAARVMGVPWLGALHLTLLTFVFAAAPMFALIALGLVLRRRHRAACPPRREEPPR
jgi:predicted acylesterase/phospholipase RssA